MKISRDEILEAFGFRHATKHFAPEKKVAETDFETILEAARLSPSSFGFEPWKFLVVEKAELKSKLEPIAWGARNSLQGADRFVIILARKSADLKSGSEYLGRLMKEVQGLNPEFVAKKNMAYSNFLENDFELLGEERYLFDWACKQTYIALANMLTAAALLGVDSCPIEGFDRRKVEELLVKEGLLDPERFGVSVMASFGYRAVEPRPKTRQSAAEVIQRV